MLDNYAPRTMMILGALFSGGDPISMAKQIITSDKNEMEISHNCAEEINNEI